DVSVAIRSYRLSGSTATGRTIAQIRSAAPRVSVELVRRGDQWITPGDTTTLQVDDEVVVSAPLTAQVRVREALGPELPDTEARARLPIQTVDVAISRDEAAGHSLSDVIANLGHGLYPNAVFRAGVELPVSAQTELKKGDVVRVTGTDRRVTEFGA